METYLVLIPATYSHALSCVKKLNNDTFVTIDNLSETLNEIISDNREEEDEIDRLKLYDGIPIFSLYEFVSRLNEGDINIENYFITIVNILFHEKPT